MPAAQLPQVMTNAVLHGRGAPVRVRVRAADGTGVLTVTDAGPGIDPAFLPTAADSLARQDVARARAGTGLGLRWSAASLTVTAASCGSARPVCTTSASSARSAPPPGGSA